MKRATLILSALSLFVACNTVTEKKTVAEDMVHYRNLILNLTVNRDLDMATKDIHQPYYILLVDTSEILKIQKEVYYPNLGIRMRRHDWPSDVGSMGMPGSYIFYIAGKNNFEYAFSFPKPAFFNYGWEDYCSNTADQQKMSTGWGADDRDAKRNLFNYNLEYTSYKLDLSNRDTAEIFLHLFADSLMGLKRISLKDTTFINQSIIRQLKHDSAFSWKVENDHYLLTLKKHLNSIISDLKFNNIWTYYYAVPEMGTLIFLKFTIKQDSLDHKTDKEIKQTSYYISVSFINGEYHVPIYL